MCYFLSVSYLLVQYNPVILPKNVNLHTFLKVYAWQAYHCGLCPDFLQA